MSCTTLPARDLPSLLAVMDGGEVLSVLDELRLRRWARENYVARVNRDERWHRVILDEMARKDAELRDEMPWDLDPQRVAGALVPLPPTSDRPYYLLDGAHAEMGKSRVLLAVPEVDQAEGTEPA